MRGFDPAYQFCRPQSTLPLLLHSGALSFQTYPEGTKNWRKNWQQRVLLLQLVCCVQGTLGTPCVLAVHTANRYRVWYQQHFIQPSTSVCISLIKDKHSNSTWAGGYRWLLNNSSAFGTVFPLNQGNPQCPQHPQLIRLTVSRWYRNA